MAVGLYLTLVMVTSCLLHYLRVLTKTKIELTDTMIANLNSIRSN